MILLWLPLRKKWQTTSKKNIKCRKDFISLWNSCDVIKLGKTFVRVCSANNTTCLFIPLRNLWNVSSKQEKYNSQSNFNYYNKTIRDFFIKCHQIRRKLEIGSHLLKKWISHFRSSHSEVLCWKGVLKKCSKLTGDHRCQSAKHFYWNRTLAWVFSCKFAAYFQNTFSREHLWMAVFDIYWKALFFVFNGCYTFFWCIFNSLIEHNTVKNPVISLNFLVWKFFEKAQCQHSFGRMAFPSPVYLIKISWKLFCHRHPKSVSFSLN